VFLAGAPPVAIDFRSAIERLSQVTIPVGLLRSAILTLMKSGSSVAWIPERRLPTRQARVSSDYIATLEIRVVNCSEG